MFVVHVHGDHKVHEARVTETLTLILGGLHSDAGFGCTTQVSIPGCGRRVTTGRREGCTGLLLRERAVNRRFLRVTGRHGRGAQGRGPVYVRILFVAETGQGTTDESFPVMSEGGIRMHGR